MAAESNKASTHPANTAQALQALFHALDPVSLLRSQRPGKEGGTEQRCPAAQISPSTVAESNDPSPRPASTAPALLDPVSLLLSQNSATDDIVPLRLTTDHYVVERGPRYDAYARLRESRLRMKHARQEEPEDRDLKLTPPPKKQVRFHGNLGGGGRRGSPSILAQSVPDFASVLRKENRKPPALPSLAETTPPSKSWSKAGGGSKGRGSKSVGAAAGEKKGGLMARKSYASVEELKGLSCAAASAINGDDRGRIGRGNGIGRTILGYRKF
ncbi:uncharacterized protein LOC115745363 [Rhodamnia argentea]|uniref:Uncharacterized protein LOC115745363 n=1 Tax=Rhodamnia argentea TaxID=178133 RepID=A0A8B8PR89_9MYRT|nr:uncharacterized protein LOC115745363 [Rhodamnia argentea]